jgi:AcrR family transcriptional regulator
MSSSDRGTRGLILDAARRALTRPGRREVSMAEIAKEAGISRQAVYLHFETRTELLAALVRHVDDVHGFDDLWRACEREPDGSSALWELIGAWGGYVARISDVARAMKAAGATDDDAARAFGERMRGFTRVCARFVARLDAEGHLVAADWSASEATDFLATLLSIGNWQELVEERGWSRKRYVAAMRRCVRQTLLAPTAPWNAAPARSRKRS